MRSSSKNKQSRKLHPAISILVLTLSVSTTPLKAEALISEQELNTAKALFSGPSEEDYYKTDEMLVSATGSLKPVFLAPSVASVITKEEIEAMGATTLDEVLETVPGLHVMPSLLVGPYLNNYSIRGISTSFNPQTLLLINGIPQSKLWSGGNDFRFVLPVSAISRVEIVRGPGSAIHGADAFTGTINIITKDGQEVDGTQTGIRAGSFDTYDIWAQYGKNTNGWDIFASFETLVNGTDENRIVDADLQTLLDLPPPNGFGTSASYAPGSVNANRKHYNFNISLRKNRWTVRVSGLKMWDAGMVVGIAPVLDPISLHSSNRYIADLEYENVDLHPDWKLSFRTNYSYLNDDNNYIIFPAGVTLPIDSDGNVNFTAPAGITSFNNGLIGNPDEINKTLAIETTAFFTGINQHQFRFSVGFKEAKFEAQETKNFGPGIINGSQKNVDDTLTDVTGTSLIYGQNYRRRLSFLSLQDEWTFSRTWELTAGVRYDDYSDFGNTTNSRAALVWQTRYDINTKLLYGRAFRAPTVSELIAKNNPIGLGNNKLKPEIIDTIELAMDYRPTVDLTFNANIFYYEIDGLIEFVPDDKALTSTAQNTRDQISHGAEFEFNWKINSQLQFNGNSAWFKSIDKSTSLVIPNVPRAQAYGNLHWKFSPKFSVDTQWFWIGYHARKPDDTREAINNYHLTNFTLRRKDIIKNIDLAFAIRNVFNTDIRKPSVPEIPNDIPMNGRSIWGEIRVKF